MFSSAFKSFTSNISANYDLSKQPSASAGAWTIFDAKKKTGAAQVSVFVFKRESLEVTSNGFGARPSATSIRKAQDEVVERFKKEASSLARLRHPSVLQLVEPVEETRSGGLMFATEQVVASLYGALAQKDETKGNTGRASSVRDSKAWQAVDLDELEIQKGLLQIAKGLEFMHDSARLVHGNLTPDAIFINSKSDWKLSGLAFAGPPAGAEGHQPTPPISLSEVLHHDPRIPPSVQLNLDYTSPDFVLDSNLTYSADIFSLGLVLLACYRNPHISPIEAHGNLSTYKKIFSSVSTAPSPNNNYLCPEKLPRELELVLPRILTRRPASRMNAAEFQQSEYFNNILVNTMRFLDGLPAKSPAEKAQFMRGLSKVMPQFPKNVLAKKILSTLLDELKDRELLSVIMQNIFQILALIPKREEALAAKVLPALREIFLTKSKSEERDTAREAGLVVFLEHAKLISENCTAQQFKDDALPIMYVAMESSTHSLVDKGLQSLASILPVLDFSTVKHDLFPVIANVFSKTSSLAIKVRGLEALGVLCGAGEGKPIRQDDLSGNVSADVPKKATSSLDKFTMQEKIVPLLKAIKTKEPQVIMAALKVFQQIVRVGDIEFLAMEVMPILWSFALGPLLDLSQFKSYMDTIRALSTKIEREQMRKLQELSANARSSESRSRVTSPRAHGAELMNGADAGEDDFARLVLNNSSKADSQDPFAGAMSEGQKLTPNPPTFSWSSTTNAMSPPTSRSHTYGNVLQPQQPSRSITPDVPMSAFPSLQPSAPSMSAAWTQQHAAAPAASRLQATSYLSQPSTTPASTHNPWQSSSPPPGTQPASNYASLIAPPPQRPTSDLSWPLDGPKYNVGPVAPHPATGLTKPLALQQQNSPATSSQYVPKTTSSKSGLDKYESLL